MNFKKLINKEKLSGIWNGAKSRFGQFRTYIKDNFPKSWDDVKRLQSTDAIERLKRLSTGKAYSTYIRLAAAAFGAYFMADTVSLFTDALIPDPPPVPTPQVTKRDEKRRSITEYDAITNRHIFNSKGLMPEDSGDSGPARKTTLPLNLIGTVVLKDELKSIATLEDKSVNMIFPVRIEDTVMDKIKITKIEHLKVYFINNSTGHLEYVEIIEDLPSINPEVMKTSSNVTGKKTKDGVLQTAENNFEVERTSVDRAVSNLSEILQQARAIPNFEGGMPDGYKLLQIQPGSIFEQLGLKNQDIICGLNGDPVNDPGKAFQLFNELKTASHLEICVKRAGKKMVYNYDIK